MKPCPVCDIDVLDHDPVFCLALGAAMGSAYREIHDVTEQVCPQHRTAWVLAMLRVSRTMAALEGADASAMVLPSTDAEGK